MNRKDPLMPVKRQSLHEAVEARLEELILTGEFQAGESLPSEHEMATRLQVSRTVVRAAIRALATKGLLEIRHGVGTFVTDNGRERLAEALALSVRRGDYTPWELFIVRRGLELAVIELAVERATPEQIGQMRDLLDSHQEQLKSGSPSEDRDEHILFHQLMVHSTGNRVLMDLLDPITVFRVPQTQDSTDIELTDAHIEAYINEHKAIVDAIERRDLEAAKVAMLQHLDVVKERAQKTTAQMATSQTPSAELYPSR
jgi:GntR family transcriptional repressor for pyruvate dehydrogenase complex